MPWPTSAPAEPMGRDPQEDRDHQEEHSETDRVPFVKNSSRPMASMVTHSSGRAECDRLEDRHQPADREKRPADHQRSCAATSSGIPFHRPDCRARNFRRQGPLAPLRGFTRGNVSHTVAALSASTIHDCRRDPPIVPRFLPREAAHHRAFRLPAAAVARPALHECGDEPLRPLLPRCREGPLRSPARG